MSEFGGEAENICSHRVFRILTLNRHASSLSPMALSASIGRDAKRALNVWRVFETNRSTAINATDAISTYIQAKDTNRPD